MKIMGLSNWLLWTTWFLTFLFIATITCLIWALFLTLVSFTVCGQNYPNNNQPQANILCFIQMEYEVEYTYRDIKFTTHLVDFSSFTVVFLFLFAFSCATISFAIFFSTLFSKCKFSDFQCSVTYSLNNLAFFFAAFPAVVSIFFLEFLTIIPALLVTTYGYSRSRFIKAMVALCPNSGLMLGFTVIFSHVARTAGIQWHNIGAGVHPSDPFALIDVIVMFFVDTVLYMALGAYVENVWPGEFGTPLPFYFPLMVSNQ